MLLHSLCEVLHLSCPNELGTRYQVPYGNGTRNIEVFCMWMKKVYIRLKFSITVPLRHRTVYSNISLCKIIILDLWNHCYGIKVVIIGNYCRSFRNVLVIVTYSRIWNIWIVVEGLFRLSATVTICFFQMVQSMLSISSTHFDHLYLFQKMYVRTCRLFLRMEEKYNCTVVE